MDNRFPTLDDLRRAAQRRVPRYLWDYLEGGPGGEGAIARNAQALDRVVLTPGILGGSPQPDLTTRFLGRDWSVPFGIAPVGMSGAVWPQAEAHLARLGAAAGLPFVLSTVAAATPEEIGPLTGGRGWFQLYAPSDPDIRRDILARVRDAGFDTLVLTVDVPVLSRRPRELRQRLQNPMRLTPRILAQSALRPRWALGMLGRPIPAPRLFDKYTAGTARPEGDKHIGLSQRTVPDWDYLAALRDAWDGPLIVKGVLESAPVDRLLAAGVDALWVSNHGGRQFDAAPAPIDALPRVRAAAGPDLPVICDGAIRSGTDILRAIACGADFVMLGRAFHHGLAAAGPEGAAHVVDVLSAELTADMAQMVIDRPADARGRLWHP